MWECPNNRVARIITPKPRKIPKIDGMIGDKQCKMTIDTGAQVTVVKPAMVDVENYTGRCMVIEDYKGKQEKVKIAKVWLHLGEYSMKHEVLVSGETKDYVLLGLDN